mmetsp:Transcript_7272/g.18672  ORF Transcript_7272/g.18672 Transcript_7272/m.18672 type:complete len:266 (-) Transcript_7272:24-821(-)
MSAPFPPAPAAAGAAAAAAAACTLACALASFDSADSIGGASKAESTFRSSSNSSKATRSISALSSSVSRVVSILWVMEPHGPPRPGTASSAVAPALAAMAPLPPLPPCRHIPGAAKSDTVDGSLAVISAYAPPPPPPSPSSPPPTSAVRSLVLFLLKRPRSQFGTVMSFAAACIAPSMTASSVCCRYGVGLVLRRRGRICEPPNSATCVRQLLRDGTDRASPTPTDCSHFLLTQPQFGLTSSGAPACASKQRSTPELYRAGCFEA